ncbi:MAG TPA: hypothetical protein VJN89_05130 [Candidatus Acidoferrum sp.]|nr:hypothetical protein [Candidatus Acidoferrum sp.]
MTELRLIWKYIRAVSRYWWFVTIELILVFADFFERIFGTWLVPPPAVRILIGSGALVVAQYLAYRTEVTKKRSLLEIRPSTGEQLHPFVEMAHGETHYRMEIYNPPEAGPAHNVQVKLVQIDPVPRSEYFRARIDLPYVVRLAHLAGTVVDNATAHDINPGTSRQFELLYFWESGDHRLMVDGLNTKQAFTDARFEVEADESWQMTYEISSAETNIQRPLFRVDREGMNLSVSRLA